LVKSKIYDKVVEISSHADRSVELRGLAAEQWLEAIKIGAKSRRAQEYLADISLWAQQRVLDPDSVAFLNIVIDKKDGVICTTYRSATIIYLTYGPRVIVIWLSGLFRPLSEFGQPIPTTVH
jgi:hypothetical protein